MIKPCGFTLLESMVTLLMIAILATLTYPSFQNHLYRARRLDGQTALLNMAALMENHYLNYHTYLQATPSKLGLSEISPQGYYQLAISSLTDTSYLLTATPLSSGAQAHDPCATLTLNSAHLKGPSFQCWQ